MKNHLRRYTVWLTGQEASRGLILQSKLDRQVWSQVEKQVWQLDNGMAVQWLAFRGIDPEQGIALQQIENNNGVLRQTSRLLPFEKLIEIEEFLGLVGEERENISVGVDSESGLSELAGWIVTGKTIDFHQDLPGFIDQVIDQAMPEFIAMDTVQFQALPEIQPAEPNSTLIEPSIDLEKTTAIFGISSFWFEVATISGFDPVPTRAPTRLDLEGSMPISPELEVQFPESVLVLIEQPIKPEKPICKAIVPTRLDLEGIESISKVKGKTQTVDLGVGKPIIIFKAPIVKQEVINLDRSKPKEKPGKQQLKVTVVEERRCFPEKRILGKPEITTIVFKPEVAAAVVAPTRMFLEGYKGQEEFTDKEEVDQVDVDTLIDDRTEKRQELIMTSEIKLPLTVIFKPTRLDLEGLEGFGGQAVEPVVIYQAQIYQPTW